MTAELPPDIAALIDGLDAATADAKSVIDGLSEADGTRAPEPGRWSVAECLDHLGTGNTIYLQSMIEPARRARALGRMRTRPAKPGLIGGIFVAQLEPPPRRWFPLPAPRKIRPRPALSLAGVAETFFAAQRDVRAFLIANADLDLARIHFPNPFIRGIFFSLATGMHVIAAHERRHLLQARRARHAVEGGNR